MQKCEEKWENVYNEESKSFIIDIKQTHIIVPLKSLSNAMPQ